MNIFLNPSGINKGISFGDALYIVNLHSKAATNPSQLYQLKNAAIKKLIEEGKATKIGLQFSTKPKNAYQRTDVLITIDSYLFHTPMTKEDIYLPHLGEQNPYYKNPKPRISYTKAVSFLEDYVGFTIFNKVPKNILRPPWALSSYLDR